jgi:hypothetical protein
MIVSQISPIYTMDHSKSYFKDWFQKYNTATTDVVRVAKEHPYITVVAVTIAATGGVLLSGSTNAIRYSFGLMSYDKQLGYSIFENDLRCAEKLLIKGANPNNKYSDNKYPNSHFTPLNRAILYSTPEMVDLLIRYGADVNFNRPLLCAINLLKLDMVKSLYAAGADPYEKVRTGETILEYVDRNVRDNNYPQALADIFMKRKLI